VRQKEAIESDKTAKTIGPYSQGIAAGNFIFTSGQIPILPDGSLVGGDIQAQTRQCLENIKAILAARSAGMDALVKCPVFVIDITDFKAVNNIY